jgi:hypothetical protein
MGRIGRGGWPLAWQRGRPLLGGDSGRSRRDACLPAPELTYGGADAHFIFFRSGGAQGDQVGTLRVVGGCHIGDMRRVFAGPEGVRNFDGRYMRSHTGGMRGGLRRDRSSSGPLASTSTSPHWPSRSSYANFYAWPSAHRRGPGDRRAPRRGGGRGRYLGVRSLVLAGGMESGGAPPPADNR